jgi:hypothetical protein
LSQKWFEEARKKLGPGDEIQKSYSGSFDGKSGYILFANEKVLFVHIKGFLTKTYDVILDLPYPELESSKVEGQ